MRLTDFTDLDKMRPHDQDSVVQMAHKFPMSYTMFNVTAYDSFLSVTLSLLEDMAVTSGVTQMRKRESAHISR